MELELKDKVAIVTGAGMGIGKATAVGFAEEGVKVVIADMDAERGASAERRIKDSGAEALFIQTDVASWSQVERLAKETLTRYGQIDIMANVAGAWRINFFTKMPREDWDFEIAVNYYGTLNCCKAVIDHMVSRKMGCIINVGSDAGRIGEPHQPVYSGTKGAVIAFTKALAKEVGRNNVRVNSVCPSFTLGERRIEQEEAIKRVEPEKYEDYKAQMDKMVKLYPMRKFGIPEDVANMIVFLASERRAGHVTGQTISVNGGYCMP